MTRPAFTRLIWLSVVVLVLIPVLQGCGDDGDKEEVAVEPLVLVADFVTEAGAADEGGKEAARIVVDDLRRLFDENESVVIRLLEKPVTAEDGVERARELAEDEKALLVIWGTYSGQGEGLAVAANFEIMDRPELERALARVAVAQITSFGLEQQPWGDTAWLPVFAHGLIQYWRGVYDEALDGFEELGAEHLDSLSPEDRRTILLHRANSHLYTGDVGRAVDDYTQLTRLNEQDSMAYYNRGLANARAGNDEDAIADFEAAAKLAEEEPRFRIVASPEVAKSKTFTVIMGLADAEWRVMRRDILPEFESEHKVRVRPFQFESTDLSAHQLRAMMAIGVGVDIVTLDNNTLAPLVEGELVDDLSEHEGIIPDSVVPSLLPLLKFEDTLFFMPYRPNVKITFYNEGKFEQHGIAPPRTWEELAEVAALFEEEEGGGRVAIQGAPGGPLTATVFEFIWAAGGDPLTLNDEGSVTAFEFLQGLDPDLSACSRHADFNSMNVFLAADTCYLGRNWAFAMNVVVRDANRPDIKAYSGWSGPAGEFHVLGGEVIGIPTGSPDKELALEFIEFLMSKEIQEVLVARMGWPSMRSDAYGEIEEWQEPYFDAVLKAVENARARPNVLYWEEVDEAINNAFEEIVLEKKPVKPTLDKYADVIRQAEARADAGQ